MAPLTAVARPRRPDAAVRRASSVGDEDADSAGAELLDRAHVSTAPAASSSSRASEAPVPSAALGGAAPSRGSLVREYQQEDPEAGGDPVFTHRNLPPLARKMSLDQDQTDMLGASRTGEHRKTPPMEFTTVL